jgi:hypothetical protein
MGFEGKESFSLLPYWLLDDASMTAVIRLIKPMDALKKISLCITAYIRVPGEEPIPIALYFCRDGLSCHLQTLFNISAYAKASRSCII